jgi:hypothetical protein
MQLKTATLYDLLQADCKSTYQCWVDTLTLLRQITDASARSMMEDELKQLYAKAIELSDTNQLNGMNQSKMNIILSRPVEQWVILNRHPSSPLIATY